MLSFQNYITEQYLEEKLILYNQGKKYGQIVFLAGGVVLVKGLVLTSWRKRSSKFVMLMNGKKHISN